MTDTPLSAPLDARYFFLVAGVSLVAVDVSIMDTLLPEIVKQLNILVADASLVDAITVTVGGALMVPAGKLADLVGAKRVLLTGLIVLVAASLATGMAMGLGVLMTARIGQGIAFAMVLTTVIAMLILFAIQQGSRYGWLWSQEDIEFLGNPWTLALSPTPVMLGLGVILLTAFILVERWRAKRRLDVVLDTQLFQARSYVWGTLGIALTCSALICALLVVSL